LQNFVVVGNRFLVFSGGGSVKPVAETRKSITRQGKTIGIEHGWIY